MVKKFKSIVKIAVLCFSISLFSCQDEILEDKGHAEVHDPNAVSYETFKANTNISSVKEFFKAKTTKKSPTAKGVSLPEYDIDTLLIKQYVTSETNESYTFRIFPKELTEVDTTSIYNLVINKVDNEWETIIFHLERDTPENIASSHKVYKSISEVYRSYGLPNEFGRMSWCANATSTVQCDGSCFRNHISPCDGITCPTGACISTTISWGLCEGIDDSLSPPIYFLDNLHSSGGGGSGSAPTYAESILGSLNLTSTQSSWLNLSKQEAVKKAMVDYLWTNKNSQQSQELVKLGIDFLRTNPDFTIDMFKNWFLDDTREGSDGEVVDNIDNILNTIQYQTKPLPSYSAFDNAFPKDPYPGQPYYFQTMPAEKVYKMVGGNLLSLYNQGGGAAAGKDNPYRNACTVRFSLAMNKLGISIPNNALSRQGANINGQSQYYYLQAVTANDFMLKTFGETPYKLEGADANDPVKLAKLLKGKYGIYVIINKDPRPTKEGGAGYTGHVDIIKNGYIPGGTDAVGVAGGIKSIRVWVLK